MKEDIFKKAAQSLSSSTNLNIVKETEVEVIKEADFSIIDKEVEQIDVKNWDDFKNAMQNEHAIKFHKLLKALPPAQFMDRYIKALEFVKPKIIRSTADDSKKVDRKVQVHIKRNVS